MYQMFADWFCYKLELKIKFRKYDFEVRWVIWLWQWYWVTFEFAIWLTKPCKNWRHSNFYVVYTFQKQEIGQNEVNRWQQWWLGLEDINDKNYLQWNLDTGDSWEAKLINKKVPEIGLK